MINEVVEIQTHSLVSVGYKPLELNAKPLELTYNNEQAWLARGVEYIDPIALLSTQEALDLIAANAPNISSDIPKNDAP